MQSRPRAQIGLLVALLSASIALRLVLLFERPLWFDELFSIWAARLPLADLVAALRLDSGPPGFYLLVKPLAFGADLLVRVPSFLAALLLFVAARSLPKGGPRAWFVMLLSGSLLVNLYAAEARPYALLALLCLAAFLLALEGNETGRRLVGLVAATALVLYTHSLAILAVAALLLLAALARRWRSCLALAAGAVLFAPWAPVLLAQPAAALAWMREPVSDSLVGFLSSLGGVGRVPAPFGPPVPAALFLAGAAAGVLSLFFFLARARTDRAVREPMAFVLLVLLGALAAGAWRPVAFAGRTELVVLPVWLWGLSRATSASRPLRQVCAASLVLGLCATLFIVLAPHPPSPPAAVTETITRVAAPGDIVVAATGFYLPSRLARERGRLAAAVQPLSEDVGRHPGWFVPALPGPAEEHSLAAAAAEVAPGRHLFLVMAPAYATPGIANTLAALGGRARELMRSPDALVILWTKPPR